MPMNPLNRPGPTNPLRQQGVAFSVLALVLSLLIAVSPAWSSEFETTLLALLIFFLGVPHGAFDVIFAKRLYRLVSLKQWLVFCTAYVVLAALVVGFWWLLPALFLSVFFVGSAFHFSGDLENGTPVFLRFWYAGSMLIFPAWLHEADVALLFTYLVPGRFPEQMAAFLHGLALPWAVGLCIALLRQRREQWSTTLEVVAVGLLATAAPPLIGFTVFFCLMHSARHAIRTRAYAADLRWIDLIKKAAAPMLACLLAGFALWPSLRGLNLDAAVIRTLFVGLAALTVPHMVLIERVRFSGWRYKAHPSP